MQSNDLAQPGPEHEALARHAGEWDSTVTLAWPGMPPMELTATATAQMILGGRFLEIISRGTLMGHPVETRYLLGFDRRHGAYDVIALDTLGTYWVTGRGVRDGDGVLRMHGEDDDPSGKQVYAFELELISDDEREFRIVFSQLALLTYDQPLTMVKVHSVRRQ